MQKPFSEWFDPTNISHVMGLMQYQRTLCWPQGLIPDEVWFNPGWLLETRKRVGEFPMPASVAAWDEEYARILGIVGDVYFPAYRISVTPHGDDFVIQVHYEEADVDNPTAGPQSQSGRCWLFPAGQTVGQIVQTCFLAIKQSSEHRVREHFTFRQRAVFGPHQDVVALANRPLTN